MYILAIDTSCDETSVAITCERKVIANALYSQVLMHREWGGVVPSLARRAHEERIDLVVAEAIKKSGLTYQEIDCFAVTQGPGLAIALEVGIKKAKELSEKYGKRLISVNHLEGHIYSCFVQNSRGNPNREIKFPYLASVVSGGHTGLTVMKDHLTYEVIGETRDDAAGEALDKAARMLGLGYPGGSAIERLAEEVDNSDVYKFTRPMLKSHDLDFSFSGLKTALYYLVKDMGEQKRNEEIHNLASSFQEAVFDTLIRKTDQAMKQTGLSHLLVGGGVIANKYLRKKYRTLAKKYRGSAYFPTYTYLTGDNAAMIGIVAYYKALQNKYVDADHLDRIPRYSLEDL
ncbi:tRNA (adenosine(37)-N6)-threonylcarbamoyltransferase complex transferase subunit TsaD [Candidatus Roizmanbacteria bacterium]|nr:tRNA (adenosine(37)-N6)-threonylcarbamoyltransferase complex transferase subunit TsaD [Candidatus Roizmanbacteria bacterium]